jgi:hypothetical protein
MHHRHALGCGQLHICRYTIVVPLAKRAGELPIARSNFDRKADAAPPQSSEPILGRQLDLLHWPSSPVGEVCAVVATWGVVGGG